MLLVERQRPKERVDCVGRDDRGLVGDVAAGEERQRLRCQPRAAAGLPSRSTEHGHKRRARRCAHERREREQ